MKEICINKNIFTKSVFYGLWGLATFGIIALVLISYTEFQSEHNGKEPNILCYKSIFQNKQVCFDSSLGGGPEGRYPISIILLSIDCIIIALWVNHKNQLIKLKWCDEIPSNRSENHDK